MPRKRAPWMPDPTEEKARQKAAKAAQEFGVFVWEAENRYRRESALRIYKRRPDAERYAETHEGNLVVRPIHT